jgi:hypothetical protein
MADIYRPLSDAGLDRKFVQRVALPAHWSDANANDEAGRRRAEESICEALGLSELSFQTGSRLFNAGQPPQVNYISPEQALDSALSSVIDIAARMAELCRSSLVEPLSCWLQNLNPEQLRQMTLEQHRVVNLRSLVKVSWSLGVPVIPLSDVPARSKSIDAIVDCSNGRPVVALSSRHASPAWMVWHLAFALSHISAVAAGHRSVLVDLLVPDTTAGRAQGLEFASILVHGKNNTFIEGHERITGVKLAALARKYSREHGLEAGAVVTGFAIQKNTMGGNTRGPADKALINLGIQDGGLHQARNELALHVDVSQLAPMAARFFKSVAGY